MRTSSVRARRAAALSAALLCLVMTGCSASEANAPTSEPVNEAADPRPSKGEGDEPAPEAEPAEVTPLALNADGLLAGNAPIAEYAAGEPGAVSVVFAGPFDPDQSIVPFVFRNNTDAAVSHVDASATARDAGGTLAGAGSSQGTTPAQIPPGGLGMAYIFFDSPIPADAQLEFTFETSPADTSSYNTADLRTVEAVVTGDAIVGTAVNETGATLEGPFSVTLHCFDEAGALKNIQISFANEDGPIEDGGTVSFSMSLYGDPCGSFLIGTSGWFS